MAKVVCSDLISPFDAGKIIQRLLETTQPLVRDPAP
jgi:hypothetical protein